MKPEDKSATFMAEIGWIQSDPIKRLVVECLKKAPDYFFSNCPASSTGKYHPADEAGPNGTIIHTKRVCATSRELARAMDVEDCLDEIIAAAILHDSWKYGPTRKQFTSPNHPLFAADAMAEIYKAGNVELGLDRTQCLVIYSCIKYHMGKWGKGKMAIDVLSMGRPEMCLHLADVVASRNFIHVKIGG